MVWEAGCREAPAYPMPRLRPFNNNHKVERRRSPDKGGEILLLFHSDLLCSVVAEGDARPEWAIALDKKTTSYQKHKRPVNNIRHPNRYNRHRNR